MDSAKRGWSKAATFVVAAVIAAFLAELAVHSVSPPMYRREVEDAMRDLRTGDPDILAISSSHGRSFHELGREIARRTNGGVSLIAFPLEAGMVRAMEWVLRNRAVPLLDERDEAGNRKRTRFKHLLFGVTWWDTCRRGDVPRVDHNVVSRAWALDDFVRDVAAHGLTDVNRNFLRYQLQRMERFSRLVHVHGTDPLQAAANKLARKLMPMASTPTPSGLSPVSPEVIVTRELAKWRKDIETGQLCLLSPSEREALERMEAFAKERALDFTIVLFPLMPKTVTPAGKRTIDRFAEIMKLRGQAGGYRVIDMSTLPAILDEDFMRDMDHLNPSGNRKFIDRALQHELAFLLAKPTGEATRRVKEAVQ